MGKNQSASNLTNIIKQDANGSIAFMSGSTMLMTLSNTGQMSGSVPVLSASTASFVALAQSASNAVAATTASSADNFLVRNTLTAQTLVVQTITSSVDFVTGSTRFGSILGNTHVFTGSVFITGSIGVGVNNPTFPLTRNGMTLRASGTDGAEFVMLSSTDTGFTGGALVRNGADFGFINRTSGSLIFATNAIERMWVSSSGNVGIGTSSPTTKLFVLGNGSYGTTTSEILTSDATIFSSEMNNDAYNSILQLVSVRQSLSTGASSNGFLGFSTIDDSNGEGIRDAGRIAIVNETASSRNSATALGFWTNTGGTKTNTATERMRITSGGSVGIGTSSPNNLLSVRGNLDLGATGFSYAGPSQYGGLMFPRGQILYSNTNTQNQFYLSSNAYTNNNGVFVYRNSGQPAVALGLDNGGIAFLTAGNGTADATISWTTAIGISNNGTVTRPSQPSFLAYSTGFTVTGGGWYNISNAMTTEAYDVSSNYSGGRFTAPVAGRYFFYFGGWSSISSNGERYGVCARVNDGGFFYIGGGNYCITDSPLSGYSIIYNLNTGDYVDLFAFSAVGGTWGGGSHSVWWGGYLL